MKNQLRVVLLAAGQGKRMKSAYPKVLHEVLGKSILQRVLEAAAGLSPEHIHLVIGHEAEQVKAHLAKLSVAAPLSTHLQEPQLGTGHALSQVAPSLGDFKGTLLVSVADAPLLTTDTLASLVEAHAKGQAVVSLLTTLVEDAKNYGRILRDPNGQVRGIVEDKDASEDERRIKEINPAIYCFAWPEVKPGLEGLTNNNKQAEYYLTDLVGWAHKNGHALASALAPDWRELAGINSRLELAEAMRLMRDRCLHRLALESGVTIVDPSSTWIGPEVRVGQDTVIYPGSIISGNVEIGSNCHIGPHTQIVGPVKIGSGSSLVQSLVSDSELGENSRVGPFAHLRGGNKLGDNCRVGNFVELKKTDIGNDTNVSHLSYVGDAELGSAVNIGAGTITANYDKLTGKKSKTVIGANSSTGSNSVLVAPVSVGSDCMVAAGSVITKDVPEGALAVARAKQENKADWVKSRRRVVSRG